MSDKFCVDCKHSSGEGTQMRCMHPYNFVKHKSMEIYLVTGVEQQEITAVRSPSCVGQRSERSPELLVLVCGPSGAWFEAKE